MSKVEQTPEESLVDSVSTVNYYFSEAKKRMPAATVDQLLMYVQLCGYEFRTTMAVAAWDELKELVEEIKELYE